MFVLWAAAVPRPCSPGPQYFSILIWIVGDAYYSYAVCIAVITWFSIISAAYEAHQNMKRLAEIAHFEWYVRSRAPGGSAWRGGRPAAS